MFERNKLMFLGLHMLGFDFDVLMLANFKDLLHEDVGSVGHDPVTPWGLKLT
jgi:hypothetical protein